MDVPLWKRRSTGKNASGKIHRIKSDTLYLINAVGVSKPIQVFTEESMLTHFQQERKSGRYPPDVELAYVPLPPELQLLVDKVRKEAVDEVTP